MKGGREREVHACVRRVCKTNYFKIQFFTLY